MKSHLERLLGCTPSPRLLSGRGSVIAKRDGIKFGDVGKIEMAALGDYSTCRGRVPEAALLKLIDVLADDSGMFTEDDHMEAENEGVWDWICHQYTLYSVSPIFLDRAIRRIRETGRDIAVVDRLASVSATTAICLTDREYVLNQTGKLPIFRIEDVLLNLGWTRKKEANQTPQTIRTFGPHV